MLVATCGYRVFLAATLMARSQQYLKGLPWLHK